MLFYVESKLYPGRTMVLVCSRSDSVARAKALLLHILSEVTHKTDHFFRLKYRGEFMKDALSLQDYGVDDMSVVKMIPLYHSSQLDMANPVNPNKQDDIFVALDKEKVKFHHRVSLLNFLKVLIWLHLLCVIGNFVTAFWWSGLWMGLLTLTAKYFTPVYLHVGGSVGKMSTGFLLAVVAIGDLAMFLIAIIRILIPECDEGSPYYNEHGVLHCSYRVWFAVVFLPVQMVLCTVTAVVCVLLYTNFQFEAGQLVERCLVETRDINKVLYSALHGNGRERHNAAFELINLALTDDDNKFHIVQEGGLQVLQTLLTSGQENEETKDYAAEALAELLTVEAIQDEFISEGGLLTLGALLHSSREHVVHEASCALSFIISRDEHKMTLINNNGLNDVIYPIIHGCSFDVAKILSGVLLDLSLDGDVRHYIIEHHDIVMVLSSLLAMGGEVQRSGLQTMELLAIHSGQVLQPLLLDHLISIATSDTMDEGIAQLVGKILSYYANSEEGVRLLASQDHLIPAMTALVDAGEVDVISGIMRNMSLYQPIRSRLEEMGVSQLRRKITSLPGTTVADLLPW
ncbi:uncharacterized protein [Dysidea avara]|uniref:uncharacterized protein isoform X2 n=1 Tax=Dysidea avara TaxID=196820 RepID=UPI003321A56A